MTTLSGRRTNFFTQPFLKFLSQFLETDSLHSTFLQIPFTSIFFISPFIPVCAVIIEATKIISIFIKLYKSWILMVRFPKVTHSCWIPIWEDSNPQTMADRQQLEEKVYSIFPVLWVEMLLRMLLDCPPNI